MPQRLERSSLCHERRYDFRRAARPLVSMLLVLDTGVDGWVDNASAEEIGDLILSLDPILELVRVLNGSSQPTTMGCQPSSARRTKVRRRVFQRPTGCPRLGETPDGPRSPKLPKKSGARSRAARGTERGLLPAERLAARRTRTRSQAGVDCDAMRGILPHQERGQPGKAALDATQLALAIRGIARLAIDPIKTMRANPLGAMPGTGKPAV